MTTFNIEDLSLKQIREIQALCTAAPCLPPAPAQYEYPVGKNVAVRTVTMIYTGKLVQVTHTDLVLVDCSWIPETERFASFIAQGKTRECEPYPDGLPVFVSRGALLDFCELRADLPRKQG